MAGCRRTAILISIIILGAIILAAGLWGLAANNEVAIAEPVPPSSPGLPAMTVYSDPSCECCVRWIRHLQAAGLHVTHVHDVDMAKRKDALGIPSPKRSCHTATIDGYIVEGHVPAEDIIRMVRTRPEIKGLALPGMPSGSPGMEPLIGRGEAYTVEVLR